MKKEITRSVRVNIGYSNKNKLDTLDKVLNESISVVNKYIDKIWSSGCKNDKFVKFKVEDTFLSARMQQCLGKQALEIVRTQRKKKKQTKPVFKFPSIILDPRFLDIKYDLNSFDIWFKLWCIGDKIRLKLPSRRHKMFSKYSSDWNISKSVRLLKLDNKYYIDFIFSKEVDIPDVISNPIGIDIGYKKLITSSNGNFYGTKDLEDIYTKISRKVRNSKKYKKSLTHRNNKTNQEINNFLNSENPTTIIVEDLKNVKLNSKLNTKFMNKLQYWTYSRTLSNLTNKCEERCIKLVKVSPAYTSQTCSICGFKHINNRSNEKFLCLNCGYSNDADLNASLNILHRGVYSPSTILKTN